MLVFLKVTTEINLRKYVHHNKYCDKYHVLNTAYKISRKSIFHSMSTKGLTLKTRKHFIYVKIGKGI